jgi:hypothetical protein
MTHQFSKNFKNASFGQQQKVNRTKKEKKKQCVWQTGFLLKGT